MTPVTYHAQYSDGATYRVMYDPNEHKTYLATVEGGFMSVPYLVNGAEFVRFDFHYQPQPGLRACDWATNIQRLHAHLALLTPPTRPAELPTPIQQPEDFRLHLETDSDPFRALQATGAKAEMEYRANRQQARREMLAELNQPDAQRVCRARQARDYAAEVLHARKPRGGQFIIKGE